MNRAQPAPQCAIVKSYQTFVFPCELKQLRVPELQQVLLANGFRFYSVDEDELGENFYGPDVAVRAEELDQYFFPFVENIMLPKEPSEFAFKRYSKCLGIEADFWQGKRSTPFRLRSADIVICPFGIGLLCMHVDLGDASLSLDDTLSFMNMFRVLKPRVSEHEGGTVQVGERRFRDVQSFILSDVFRFIQPYLLEDDEKTSHFSSIPFFEDERMYTYAFLAVPEGHVLDDVDVFRAGRLDGLESDGTPFVSSTNRAYIDRFLKRHLHDRFAPGVYTITTEHAHVSISSLPADKRRRRVEQHLGTHYLNFLLHYYYKLMLLRFSIDYSLISWTNHDRRVQDLIESITIFASKSFFREVSVRSEGQEFAALFRRAFHIDELYDEVRHTIHDLYRTRESVTTARTNQLLFMLTVFTVLSGIYGMNLVIEDWQGDIDWGKMARYTAFEWFTFVVAVLGMAISVGLVFAQLYQFARVRLDSFRRRNLQK